LNIEEAGKEAPRPRSYFRSTSNMLYTQRFLLKIRNCIISSFCHAHKRPSPFFLYIPTKKPSFQR